MTNKQWLESLTPEQFEDWLENDELEIFTHFNHGVWAFDYAQPSPKYKTLKKEGIKIADWLKEERLMD